MVSFIEIHCRDSSGSILRDGSAKKGSFMYSLNSSEPVTLRPGYNTVAVEAPAGHVGRYEVSQMSLQAGEAGRLDFVLDARCLRTEASFDVVSEAPAVSVVPGGHGGAGGGGGELVAGLEQEVRLVLTTGSRHIQEVR